MLIPAIPLLKRSQKECSLMKRFTTLNCTSSYIFVASSRENDKVVVKRAV